MILKFLTNNTKLETEKIFALYDADKAKNGGKMLSSIFFVFHIMMYIGKFLFMTVFLLCINRIFFSQTMSLNKLSSKNIPLSTDGIKFLNNLHLLSNNDSRIEPDIFFIFKAPILFFQYYLMCIKCTLALSWHFKTLVLLVGLSIPKTYDGEVCNIEKKVTLEIINPKFINPLFKDSTSLITNEIANKNTNVIKYVDSYIKYIDSNSVAVLKQPYVQYYINQNIASFYLYLMFNILILLIISFLASMIIRTFNVNIRNLILNACNIFNKIPTFLLFFILKISTQEFHTTIFGGTYALEKFFLLTNFPSTLIHFNKVFDVISLNKGIRLSIINKISFNKIFAFYYLPELLSAFFTLFKSLCLSNFHMYPLLVFLSFPLNPFKNICKEIFSVFEGGQTGNTTKQSTIGGAASLSTVNACLIHFFFDIFIFIKSYFVNETYELNGFLYPAFVKTFLQYRNNTNITFSKNLLSNIVYYDITSPNKKVFDIK